MFLSLSFYSLPKAEESMESRWRVYVCVYVYADWQLATLGIRARHFQDRSILVIFSLIFQFNFNFIRVLCACGPCFRLLLDSVCFVGSVITFFVFFLLHIIL